MSNHKNVEFYDSSAGSNFSQHLLHQSSPRNFDSLLHLSVLEYL